MKELICYTKSKNWHFIKLATTKTVITNSKFQRKYSLSTTHYIFNSSSHIRVFDMDPLVLNLVCEKMAESDLAIKPYMAVNGRLFTLYGIITESVSIKVHE